MKIYISAQAQQKHFLSQEVQSRAIVIIEHMLMLTIMPDSSARNHWKGEIAGQMNLVHSLKSTKKPPSAKELIKWTYEENLDFITNRAWITNEIDNFLEDYGYEYTGNVDDLIKEFNDICYQYFSWLAEKLSAAGTVKNREIYQKLDELV